MSLHDYAKKNQYFIKNTSTQVVLDKHAGALVEPHYQIIVQREGTLDTMEVQVEVSDSIFSDEVKTLEGLTKKIQHEIKDLLGVSCKVKLVEPKSIQRSEGKAKRVIDKRKL